MADSRRIRGPILSAAILVTALAGGAAHAQAEGSANTEEGQSEGIGEIIVTAQKRSENLQKVPIAVSALSSAQLDDQKITNINAIATQVPNLQISTPYSDAVPVFSLRGISAVDYSQNQSSPVALYVDEVYKGLSVLTSLQTFDLERVEVLRGPQGTLYGKNTTGGAVNVFTRRPELSGDFSGYITAGLGRFDRRELMGGSNIPIVDGVLAARIAFTVAKADGFVKNRFPGAKNQGEIDDWAFRGSLAFKPSDRLDLLLRYTRSSSTPTGYGVLADNIGGAGPGGAGFGTGYFREGLGFFENEVDRPGRLRIKNQSWALTANWDIGDAATLTSVSSFDKGSWLTEEDADATPFSLLHIDYLSKARAWSQDLRLASQDNGPLKWLIGAYYNKDKVLSTQFYRYYYEFAGDSNENGVVDCLDDFITGCSFRNEFEQIRESFALYTQNSYTFDNNITLTAGLRYTKDKARLPYYSAFLGYLDPASGEEVLDFAQTIAAPPTNRLESDNLSGKIGISYELPSGALLYANLSRGYRGGSFNGQALQDPSEVTIARPERLDAIEVGAKVQTLDNRLRINSAAFFYDYRNQQFIDVLPNFLMILYNAPKSRLWGGEVEVTAQPVDPLTLRFNVSYLNAEYREVELQGQDLSGNRLILAPKWTLSGGIDWKVLEGDFGSFSLHTDSRYTSRQFYDAFNSRATSQPGYATHDARLSYSNADKSISLAAWVKNVFNKHYRVYRLDLVDTFNLDYSQRGRPREYGVQATYKF